jgi:hypothetical protein
MKTWLKSKLKERSTTDGIIMVAAGAAVIVFYPFAKLIAYGAIVYGAYTMYRKG